MSERIEPNVELIACTHEDADGILDWLEAIDGTEVLENMDNFEHNTEGVVELAARRCYKAFKPGLNANVTKIRTDSMEYFENILKSGHGSVLEHVSTTWAIENVSRVFTHELVRHRIGTAFSQESLRYVRLDELKYWLPPEIEGNTRLKDIFKETFDYLEMQQKRLFGIADLDDMSFDQKKKLTSAFRRVAPMGLATGIVFNCNVRALRWIIEQRTSLAAEAEIRFVFDLIATIAVEKWPAIFQDFTRQDDGVWVPKYSKV